MLVVNQEFRIWMRVNGITKNDSVCINCDKVIAGNLELCPHCSYELHPIRLNMHNHIDIMKMKVSK